ncbi:MAG: acyltransferase family protein [Vicinamibacterales bacterium]
MIAYSPALDGVRGIAILLVLAHHLTIVRPATAFDNAILAALHTGWAGVDLFFVLSGFLITGILLDARGSRRYFASFYARRALRIVPLYYVIIFLSYHVLPSFPVWYDRLVGPGAIPHERDFWLFISNITMARRDALSHGILGISWSLAIEEQFYLIWAIVVRILSPDRLGLLCGLLILVTPVLRTFAIRAGASEIEIYVLTPYRADALAAGALLAWLARRPVWNGLHRFGPWATMAGVLGVAGLIWRDGHTSWDGGLKQMVGYSFLALASCGLVLIATNPNERARGRRALSAAWLQMFGRYSFCLYLIHLPVMWTVRYAVFEPNELLVSGSAVPPQLLFWGLALVPAVALAAISSRLFEQPILRLKRFFPY